MVLPVLFLALGATTLTSPTPSSQQSSLSRTEQSLTDQNVLKQASHALNQIARKATPAVVSISATKAALSISEQLQLPPEEAEQMALGMGSGVIIRSDGIILTNHHVVQDAQKVTVHLDENTKVTATILGVDPKTDLAVIRINKKLDHDLPTLNFGDSDQLGVGDWILAVGNPFGLNHSVTSGIVSAVGRAELGILDIEDFIQTDAAINPGNSGGPLLNAKAEIVGINTAIFSESGGFMGVGFSIPSKIVQQVVKEILTHGRVIRGWMGISAQDLDPELANYFESSSQHGALISSVEPGGPAARGALKVGDIVTKIGQVKISSSKEFKALVAKTKINSRLPVGVIRQGISKTLEVTIREQPLPKEGSLLQQAGQAANEEKNSSFQNFGLQVQDIPPELTVLFGIPVHRGALIVDVQVGSPAFEAGLSRGDIILNANKIAVENAADFVRVAHKIRDKDLAVFYIQRGPQEKIFVPVKKLDLS